MQILQNKNTRANKTSFYLLNKIWNEVGSDKELDTILTSITQMARYALNASFSSLYLLDEKKSELVLKCINSPMENQQKRIKLNDQAGITGWVAMNGQPLIVNDVDKELRFNKPVDEIYGSPTKSIICVPLMMHRKVTGVIKLVNKSDGSYFGWQDLQTLAAAATTAALTVENFKLNDCLQESYSSTVNALVYLADSKEILAGGHSRCVAEYALMGAKELSLSEVEKRAIKYAGILHDIGKLAIPDVILNKPKDLNYEEWGIMHKHPTIGFNLLKEIPFLQDASRLILYHHEKYDGSGYPFRIKGEEIPIGARLIAVADAFDNMTTEHSYRTAMGTKDALEELKKCTGTQFCPVAVKAFITGFLKAQSSSKPD